MDFTVKQLDNDTRGWIMCVASAIACVFGASVICVDVFVRLLPGKRNFRIEESNAFLACSLSLSFGVMIFSSLYSMLPESKEYLENAGWSHQPAGLIMMAGFVGGFFGIQIVSRVLHQYMPSHVVDCHHSHDQHRIDSCHSHTSSRHSSRASRRRQRHSRSRSSHLPVKHDPSAALENGPHEHSETSPLLSSAQGPHPRHSHSVRHGEIFEYPSHARGRAITTDAGAASSSPLRRPSMFDVQKRVMSFVKDTKNNCDDEGQCYGYTDPCGQECIKHLPARSMRSTHVSRPSASMRSHTAPFHPSAASVFQDAPAADRHRFMAPEPTSPTSRASHAVSRDPADMADEATTLDADLSPDPDADEERDAEAQHHHHVPANAFLSIGLQTSIAIALHKFPEGFITYATNHANPTLGFNVFMALFVHNITEGFALALPLYMALGSRWRAMLWASLLGGLSQPLGAAIAALWFGLAASRGHVTPSAVAYACLFAVTAGIMVSVALQLLVEGLGLNHNRNVCIFFAFVSMALLGLSNSLFGGH